MNEKIEKALDILEDYRKAESPSVLDRVIPDIKAEVERLNTWHSTISQVWKDRAEKAEAKLEKQRPLIEVAMGAEFMVIDPTGRRVITCDDESHRAILRAALKLREGEGR